jgi:calcineurin-like phosphoesterase family protein
MGKIFFSADQHFWHRNIIEYCHRPFASVEEMNEVLLDNLNSLVDVNDALWLIGDIVYGHPKRVTKEMAEAIIKRIRCQNIHLVTGSHDDELCAKLPHLFTSVSKLEELKVDGQELTLCHYAMRSWRKSHYGAYQLFGHHHGRLPSDPKLQQVDVGVDCWNFKPITLKEIREYMAANKTFTPITRRRDNVR